MTKKRVWALYRVSTKMQVSSDDDIPMQKESCHQYAKKQKDWKITRELHELGISGWKKKADDRDALNEIREGAINKEFDILLVFMLDRLGRREDETPMVVSFLHDNGIEVWSVQEGKRSMENHVDKLMNYISFWQSSGESIKTSQRVRESKKHLSQMGYYQGGVPTYGYTLVETDKQHWKYPDRKLKELLPDDYESGVVKIIFDLYVNKRYGYRRIADNLNEQGYKNRSGTLFGISTIKRIIENKAFIGYLPFKSFDGEEGDTMPYNEKIVIISDDDFNKAQQIRNKRANSLKEQDKSNIPMNGKLLLTGLGYCKYCESKLTSNYLYRKNQRSDKKDQYYTNTVYRYRCPLNKGRLGENHLQNIWGSKKHDKLIINNVKIMMKSINIEEFVDKSLNTKKDHLDNKKLLLEELKKEKNTFTKQLDKLNSEIAMSLIGESKFTPEQLSGAIDGTNVKIKLVDDKIKLLQEELAMEDNNYSDVQDMAELIKDWEEKFDNADDTTKKVMLSDVVDKIYFGKDEIHIIYNSLIEEIVNKIQWEIAE